MSFAGRHFILSGKIVGSELSGDESREDSEVDINLKKIGLKIVDDIIFSIFALLLYACVSSGAEPGDDCRRGPPEFPIQNETKGGQQLM